MDGRLQVVEDSYVMGDIKEMELDIAGLTLFDKRIRVNGEHVDVSVSMRGMPRADLSNLAVATNEGIHIISGSGTRIATEWWEKPPGQEVVFVRLGEHKFMFYYVDGWKVTSFKSSFQMVLLSLMILCM